MKLVIIPPYRGVNYTPTEGHFMVRELLDNMRRKGQLEGIDVDIDEGHPVEHTEENRRDEEEYPAKGAGILNRVRLYGEGDKYDAIVTSSANDLAFFGARLISKIPLATNINSAVHVASLIGERFSIINLTDPLALATRHFVQNFGLSDKLVSVRYISYSSPSIMALVRKYKKDERIKVPEVKKVVDAIVAQCIAAIDKDRADSIIILPPHLQCFEDEVRRELDGAGYGEIQLICALSAGVEMAKAMVHMKLRQAPRAYPSDDLKAKPEFR